MNLSQVSRIGILLLLNRAIETEKNKSVFNDPMAVLCLERLMTIASDKDKRWIIREKRSYEGIQANHRKAGIRRGKAYDSATNRFIADNPNCTVINLGCGFDTRYWRINHDKCKYIEMDLPEVIELKKEILKDHIEYEVISGSVLDTSWIDKVTKNGNSCFLLIAEGLFPYIPREEAARLLKEIGERFLRSQLILDIVPEKYTKGLWKKLFSLGIKLTMGLNYSWVFGIKHPRDLEAYGKGLRVIGEEKGSFGPIITISINDPY